MKERLKQFIQYKGISGYEFCRSIGVSTGFITSMRNSTQPDKLKRISEQYPELNMEWLVYGSGEMLKNENATKQLFENCALISDSDIQPARVPLLTTSITSKADTDIKQYIKDNPSKVSYVLNLWRSDDVTFVYQVERDSMMPAFRPGDWTMMQEKPENAVIYSGLPYGIDTKDMGMIIRIIKPLDDAGTILCKSYDPEKYPDFTLKRCDYFRLYRIESLIRTNI